MTPVVIYYAEKRHPWLLVGHLVTLFGGAVHAGPAHPNTVDQ
jgi:hypothetical protein